MKQWVRALAAIVVLGLAGPAFAEHPQKREGFWIAFGLGYGSANVTTDCGCGGSDREGGFTGFLKLGGTLNPKLLLGSETNVWVKDENDISLALGSITGTVTFYPQVEGGFFLKGGVGASFADWTLPTEGRDAEVTKAGWGVLAGIGYDVRIGRNLSLTPSVNYWYGHVSDLDFEGLGSPSLKQNVVSFDLGLTFH
jgi:hypothetical protein